MKFLVGIMISILLLSTAVSAFFVPMYYRSPATLLNQQLPIAFFSVSILNVDNSAVQPQVGFSKDVTFRILAQKTANLQTRQF